MIEPHYPTAGTVFMLRAVEEMSVAETAVALALPEATVRVRFFRARSLLRESLSRDVDVAVGDAFSFDGARCDRIVARVLTSRRPSRPQALRPVRPAGRQRAQVRLFGSDEEVEDRLERQDARQVPGHGAGTAMTYAGVPGPADRTDLIAYLKHVDETPQCAGAVSSHR